MYCLFLTKVGKNNKFERTPGTYQDTTHSRVLLRTAQKSESCTINRGQRQLKNLLLLASLVIQAVL